MGGEVWDTSRTPKVFLSLLHWKHLGSISVLLWAIIYNKVTAPTSHLG